ncbi:hypothetical protein KQH62_03630 [bacterium]|nr:hypothetical protein [bacterium]
MEVKTKPQYWFQMPPKSTEELTRIWEQREVISPSAVDLDLVEQVLIARHILTPSESDLETADEVLDVFEVRERSVSGKAAVWEVRLKADLAEFIGPRGQGRFVISRDRSCLEFQFRHAGLLMLGESGVARIRGRVFDFGEHKKALTAWLPAPSINALNREARLMGVGLLLVGALSFYQATIAGPILGGLLILLGMIGLLTPRREAFFANGLLLLTTGTATLLSLLFAGQSLAASEPVLFVFWLALGLFEFVWGYRSFANFRKFRTA